MIGIVKRVSGDMREAVVGQGEKSYNYGSHARAIEREADDIGRKFQANPADAEAARQLDVVQGKLRGLLGIIQTDAMAQTAPAAPPFVADIPKRLRSLLNGGMLEKDAHTVDVAAEAGRVIVGRAPALERPQAAEERRIALDAFNALTDPTRDMSRDQVDGLFSRITTSVNTASARFQAELATEMRSVLDLLQLMKTSESVSATLKSKVEELEGLLKELKKKIGDVKELEKAASEIAAIEEKVKKLVTDTIETILKELKAPEELVAAMKTAVKFLASTDKLIRERGKQLMELGMTFLRHKDILTSPEGKEAMKKLMDTVKLLADEKAKFTDEVHKRVAQTILELRKELDKIGEALKGIREKVAGQIGEGIKGLEKMMAVADKALGNKGLHDAMSKLKDAMEAARKKLLDPSKAKEVTEEELKKLSEGFAFLAGKFKKMLDMPAKTEPEIKERDNIATLVGNALGAHVKDAKSELSKMLRFISDEYERAVGVPAYKGLLMGLSSQLAEGKKKVEDAKKEIAGRLLAEGAKMIDKVNELKDSKLSELFKGFFPPEMRESPEKVSVETLEKARVALSIAGMTLGDIAAEKSESVRNTAIGMVKKAWELLGKGQETSIGNITLPSGQAPVMPATLAGMAQAYLSDAKFRDEYLNRETIMKKTVLGFEKEGAALRRYCEKLDMGPLKDALTKIHSDAEALRKRFEAGEPITDQEFAALAGRFRFADDAIKKMEAAGLEGAPKLAASKIFAQGLDALEKGNAATADLQGFLAIEYVTGDAAYKRQLSDWSAKLEAGTIQAAEVVKKLAERFSGALERSPAFRSIKDSGVLASLKSLMDKGKSETASQQDLNALKAAQEYVKDYSKQLSAAKDPASKERVTDIHRRVFIALDKGIVIPKSKELGTNEIDVAGLQATLARNRANPPVSLYSHTKADDRKKEIDAASAWVDQTITLLDFHQTVVENGIEAARKMFGAGPEAEAKAKEVEKLYMSLGKDEKERNTALAERIIRVSEMANLTGTLDQLAAKRTEMEKSYGKNSIEASTFDRSMYIVEGALSKLYKGEKIEPKELAAAKGIRVLHFGTEDEIAKFFAQKPEDLAAAKAQLMGCVNFSEALKGKSPEVRQGIIGIAVNMAQDALENGDMGAFMAHFMGMNAYSKAVDQDDRNDIAGISMNADGKLSWNKAAFAHRLQLDRAEALGKVRDKKEQRNVDSYYDLALLAFDKGDFAGADKILKLANLYVGALGKKDDPSSVEAMKLVHRLLGDHRENKEFDKRRMRDIVWEEGDRRRWVPKEGELPGIAVRAILGKTSFEAELAKEEPTDTDKGTAFGEVLSLPKERRMDALSVKMAPLEASTGLAVDPREILGRSEADKKTIGAAYKREGAYHSKLAEKAEKGGDSIEAARQSEEAQAISTEYMEKQTGRAQALREEGQKMIHRASELKMKALSSKDEAEVKRLDEEARNLVALGTSLIEKSEGAMRALKSLHVSITTMKGDFRETGRWRYRDAAEELLTVGEELLQAKKPDMDGRQAALVTYSANGMATADQQVAREKDIWKLMQQKYNDTAKLEERVKEHEKKYKDVTWNGPKFTTPDGMVIVTGGHVISTKTQRDAIANARGAIGSRRFKSASHFTSIANESILNDQKIIQVCYHYDELRPGFSPANLETDGFPKLVKKTKYSYETDERGIPIGLVTIGYDFKGIIGALFDAKHYIAGGQLDKAREKTKDVDYKIILGYQTQRKLNDRYRDLEVEGSQKKAEKNADGFGLDMINLRIDGGEYVDESGKTVKVKGLNKEIEEAKVKEEEAAKNYTETYQRHQRDAPGARGQDLLKLDRELIDARKARDGLEEKRVGLERDRDKAWREREVINAIHKTGAPGALSENAKKLRNAAALDRIKADSVIQDIVDNGPIDPAKLLGPGDMRLILSAVGESNGWDARYYWKLVEKGKSAEAYATLAAKCPGLVKQALEHLRDRGVMINGNVVKADARAIDYALSEFGSIGIATRAEGFQRGYAITMGALSQALKQANATDAQELVEGSGGGKGSWFMKLDFDNSMVLQFALAASLDPEHIADRIEKGERVYMPGISVSVRDAVGSYDSKYWEAGSKQDLPANLLINGIVGFVDGIQSFSVGSPVGFRENIARMDRGQAPIFTHAEAIHLTNVITKGILARGGLAYSEVENSFVKVPLTKVELKALDNLLYGVREGDRVVGGYDELLDRFVSVGMGLTSVWSYTERKQMFKTVGKQAEVLDNAITLIVNNAKERGDRPPTAEEEKEIKAGMESAMKQVLDYRTTHISEYDATQKTGARWESYGRAITAAGELVVAGLLTATGFGAAVGVAFGTKALYELSEASRKAGGYQYLTSEEAFMMWGGVAMGFAGAALGEISAIATESMAVARTSQQAAVAFTTEAVAAGRMTATAATEINTATRIGFLTRTFAQGGMGTTLAGGGMMLFGGGMASYGLVKGYEAWRKDPNQMTFFEFFTTGVLGFAQATMPLGATVMPTKFSGLWQSRGIGGKIFRGSMLFLTGETRAMHESSNFFAARERFLTEFTKMPEAQLKAYASIERAAGRPLTVEEGITVMNMMPAERAGNGELISFKPIDAAAESRIKTEALVHIEAAPRIEALAKAYEEFRAGKLTEERMKDLGLSKADQALFAKDGPLAKAKPEEAQKLITSLAMGEARASQLERAATLAQEQAAPAAKERAAQIGEAFKLLLQGKFDDAAAIRLGIDQAHIKEFQKLSALPPDEVAAGIAKMAAEDVAPAGKRMTAEEAYTFRARKTVLGEAGAKIEKTGEPVTYKVGERAYTQEHAEAAADVAAAAEAILRRSIKGESVTAETAKAELAKLAAGGAEISDSKVDAVIRLAQDERFQKAAASGDRKTQLELGLDASYPISELRVSKDAVTKVVSQEAQQHIQNPALNSEALGRQAKSAAKTAEHFRGNYEANTAKANSMPKDSPGRRKLEVLAERQKLIAEAYEANAKTLSEATEARAKQESGAFEKEVGTAVKDQAPKLGISESDVSVRAKQLTEGRELYRAGKLDEEGAFKLGFRSLVEAKKFYSELDTSPTGAAEKLVAKAAEDVLSLKKFNDEVDGNIRKQTLELPDNVREAALTRGKNLVAAYDAISKGMPDAEVLAKFGITSDEATFLSVRYGLEPSEISGDIAALALRPEILKTADLGNAIGALSTSAVRGNPKVYVERLTKYLEVIYGGRDKIPPELMPKVGQSLYETMKNSAPALKKVLEGVRTQIGFERDIYASFIRLNSEMEKGQGVVDALSESGRVAKEPQEIGVIVLDGAKTWMKNGLGFGGERYAVHDRTHMGFEIGDFGLIVYMEAARKFAKENPEIFTKLQTAEGDEIVCVIPKEKLGADPQKVIAEYEAKFRATLTKTAAEMGVKVDSPLFAALADVNAHGGVVKVKTSPEGKRTFTHEGKDYASLDGALVGLEVGHSLSKLAQKPGGAEAAKAIEGFIGDVLTSKPESKPVQLSQERKAGDVKVDAYATFRVGFEGGMGNNVKKLAENNGKGVTHVENGLAGPSVVNQLGHPVTDAMTAHFQDALVESLKARGLADKVEIYVDGPMTFAFKFKGAVDMNEFHAAMQDAGKRFPAMMKERGVEGVNKATVSSTHVEAPESIRGTVREVIDGKVNDRDYTIAEKRVLAEKKAKDRVKEPIVGEMFKYRAAVRGANGRLNALIADAHLYYRYDEAGGKVVPAHSEKSALRDALTDKSGTLLVDEKVVAALETVASKKWIRTAEDLLSHLRASGVPEESIEGFFKLLGFDKIVAAKEEIGTMTPGKVFRGVVSQEVEQVILQAVGAEVGVGAPPGGKPPVKPPEEAPAAPRPAPKPEAARGELEGVMGLTLAAGQETTYRLPAEPGKSAKEYSRTQMDMAREIAVAAEQIVLTGKAPPGTKPGIELAAKGLAANEAFKAATPLQGKSNRKDQMKLALETTDARPEFIAASKAKEAAVGEAKSRDLIADDQRAASLSAEKMALDFQRYQQGERDMGNLAFFESIKDAPDSTQKIASFAAAETSRKRLMNALASSLKDATTIATGRAIPEKAAVEERAKKFADAYHEYTEAQRIPDLAVREARMKEIAGRLGVTVSEFNTEVKPFFESLKGQSAHGVATRISNVSLEGVRAGATLLKPTKPAAGPKEFEAKLTGLPKEVADDARIIQKAVSGEELSPAEASRLFSLPNEVQAKIKPGMTAEEVVDAAKFVHLSSNLEKPANPALAALSQTPIPGSDLKWGVIPKEQLSQWKERVWEAYKAAYGDIGLTYKDADALFSKSRQVAVVTDESGKIVAFMFMKETEHGLSYTLIGADKNTAQGKAAVKSMLENFGKAEGTYGVASGAVAAIQLKGGVPVVPFEKAQRVAGQVPAEPNSPGSFQNAEGKWVRYEGQRGDGPDGMNVIKNMPGFAESDLVKHAIGPDGVRPGAKPEELTWKDLMAQAVKSRELMDRPETQANCYAVSMVIDGKPQIIIKVMFGMPKEGPGPSGLPPVKPPTPAPQGPIAKLPQGVSELAPGSYAHEGIPGRTFTDMNIQNANKLVGIAADIVAGKTVPPGPLGIVAETLSKIPAFANADQKTKVAMALAVLDNAPMLQGDVNVMARHGVAGDFRTELGAQMAGTKGKHVEVVVRFDPDTGIFTSFGKAPGKGREAIIQIDIESGRITNISTAPGDGRSIPASIDALLGFKVSEPAPQTAPKPAAKPKITETQVKVNSETQRLMYAEAVSTLEKVKITPGSKEMERYAQTGREKRALSQPLTDLERAALAYDEIPRQYGLQKIGAGDAIAIEHVRQRANELAKAGGRETPNATDYSLASSEVAKLRVDAAGAISDMATQYSVMKPAQVKTAMDLAVLRAMDDYLRANPKATRDEAALAVANEVVGEALRAGTSARKASENPQQSLDTVTHLLAQAKAAKEGRFIPTTEDYAYGVISRKIVEELAAAKRRPATPAEQDLLALWKEVQAGDFAGAGRIAESIAAGKKMKEPVRGVLAVRKEETRVAGVFEDNTKAKTRREEGSAAFLDLDGKSQERVIGKVEQARKKTVDRAAELEKEIGKLTEKGAKLEAGGKTREAQKVLDEIAQKSSERGELLKEATRMGREVLYLQELQLVSGRAGYDIERVYALRPGELANIYSKAKSLKDARETMMSRLGIAVMVPGDRYGDIMGMITSGDLFGAIARKYDGGRVTGISFSSGAEGAFKISIIEPSGKTHIEYVKRLDMRPDAGGAADLINSGVPAPDVTTHIVRDGQKVDLTYTAADGSQSRYGMVRSIGEFEGKLKIGEKQRNVRAVDETAFMDMMSKPEFMDLLIKDPQAFWREFWFSVTAEYAVGSHDGHEVNRRMIKLEILEPLSQKDIADLEAQGYKVKAEKVKASAGDIAAFAKAGIELNVDADGNYTRYTVMKVGRIDTDAAASYIANTDGRGGFDLREMRWKYGSNDLYRLTEDLAMQKTLYLEFQKSGQWKFEVTQDMANSLLNNNRAKVSDVGGKYFVETKDIGIAVTLYRNKSEMPGVKKITVAEMQAEATGGGALEQGVSMFQRQFAGDPQYQNGMLGAFDQRAGEPMGMGIRITDPKKLAEIADSGMTADPWGLRGFNGEAVRPVSHADGRSTMRPEYEGFTIHNLAADQKAFYEKYFPDKQEVYVVPLEGKSEVKLAKGGAIFSVGDRNFAVFPSKESIPKNLSDRKGLWVKRNDNMIRTEAGFREMTGIATADLGPSNVFRQIMDPKKTDLVNDIRGVADDIRIHDESVHGKVPPAGPAKSSSGIPVSSGDILSQPRVPPKPPSKAPSSENIPILPSGDVVEIVSKPGLKPSAGEVTKIQEFFSALEIAAGFVPADAAAVEAAGKKLSPSGKVSEEFIGRVKLASAEERIIIAEELARGKSPDESFTELARRTLPKTKEELLALEKRLDEMNAGGAAGAGEAKKRINDINKVQDKFEQLLKFLKYPESRERILARYEAAQKARAENDAVYEATVRQNGPDDHNKVNNAALSSDTLNGIVGRRGGATTVDKVKGAYGLDPAKSGLRADQLDTARAEALKAVGIQTDAPSQDVFNLVFVADVEGRIRGMADAKGKPLYQNATITKIENMGGGTGAYRIEFEITTSRGKEKRSVIVKQVDGRADELGAGAVKEAGLVPQKVHPTDRSGNIFSYETGVTYEFQSGTKKQATKQFTIIEDIHDYALRDASGKRQQVEMVIDGKTETVQVEAVSLLTAETMLSLSIKSRMNELGPALKGKNIEELLKTPEGRKELAEAWGERPDSAKLKQALETEEGRAWLTRLARNEDPIVAKMSEMLSTPEGRKKLMQRWVDYQEMARLGLLSDRFARNTAILLVEREGQLEITFQPIDTDPVGFRLYNKIDVAKKTTATEFGEFDKDFANGTVNFLKRLAETSGQDYKGLVKEMRDVLIQARGTDESPVPLPEELQKRAQRVKAYYEDPSHEGKPVGNATPKARDLGYRVGDIDAAVDPTGLNLIQTPHRQALLDGDYQKGLSGIVGQVAEQGNRTRHLGTQIALLSAELGEVARVPGGPPPLPPAAQKKAVPSPLTKEQYQTRVEAFGKARPAEAKYLEEHFGIQQGKAPPNAAVLDNAMIVMGDRAEGRTNVEGSFLGLLAERPLVGNIKVVSAFYDEATGRILGFGEPSKQNHRKVLISAEIKEGVAVLTFNDLSAVKNPHLEALNGMKIPLQGEGPQGGGPQKPPPLPQGPKEVPKPPAPFSLGQVIGGQDPANAFAALHPPEAPNKPGYVVKEGEPIPVYHNQQHTENVAKTAYDLTLARAKAGDFTAQDKVLFGSAEEKAKFMGQVGVLHDADPARTPGAPARVAATLEWMDSPEGLTFMKERLGWDASTPEGALKIKMAKAIIQRTEFPFDVKTKPVKTWPNDPPGSETRIGKYYESKSPVDRYKEMLQGLPAEARDVILREAPFFSEYADKSSWYFDKPDAALLTVSGLTNEVKAVVPPGVQPPDFLPTTRGQFLDTIGKPTAFEQDHMIAKDLNAPALKIPGREEVINMLEPAERANWKATNDMFGLVELYNNGWDKAPPKDPKEAARFSELLSPDPKVRDEQLRLLGKLREGNMTTAQAAGVIAKFVMGKGPEPEPPAPVPRVAPKEGEGAKVIPLGTKGEGPKTRAEGIALARELKLNEDAGLAGFVDRLATGDKAALEQLAQLPIDEKSKTLIMNEAERAEKFRTRNKTIHDQARHNVYAALKESLPKEVSEQVRQAAIGGEEQQVIGKPVEMKPGEQKPGEVIAIRQGELPRAMGDEREKGGQKPYQRKVEPGWIEREAVKEEGGGAGVKPVAAKPDETKIALDTYIAEYDKSDLFVGMDKLQKAKMVRTLSLIRLAQKRASEKYGQEIKIYLVGGSVRDLARGKTPNDLDIVVSQGEMLFYSELKKVYREVEGTELGIRKLGISTADEPGQYAPDVKKAKDVAEEAKRKGSLLEIRLLWGPGKFYEKGVGPNLPEILAHDATTRDLTVNSMYIELGDLNKSGIIDPTGRGMNDINDNTVRFTERGKERMRAIINGAEPSANIIYRIFRAYDMAARMGAKMEPETKQLIRQLVEASNNNPRLKECLELGLRRVMTEGTAKAPGILRGLHDDGLMALMPPVDGTVNPVLREIGQNDLKALVEFLEGKKSLDDIGAMVGKSAFNGALYEALSKYGMGKGGAMALFDIVGKNALTVESASELLSTITVKDAKMARVLIELTKERIGPNDPQYTVLEAMSSALDPLMVREIDNAAIAAAKKAIAEGKIKPTDFEKEKARVKRELFAQIMVPVEE
jgi:hypothetical protein